MDKEEKIDKTKKVEEVKTQKEEEPKFSKVSRKDLKKEAEMNKIESKKEKSNKGNKKKEDKEKSNHKFGYWIGGIVLLIIVLTIVTALLLLPETPEKTVEGMLNSLKNADFEGVNKYTNYDQIIEQSELLQNAEADEEMQALLFNQLNWKILNVSKEEENANVEIEITNKDFDKIISNYTQEALKIAFSGESFTEEEQKAKLKEQLENQEIGAKTVTTTIQLMKQEGKWRIQVEEDLINALLPGLQEALNSLNSIING